MFWIRSVNDFFSFIPLSSVNLDLKSFVEKLKNSPNAYFCGVSGFSEEYCPKAMMYQPVEIGKDSKVFPCDISSSSAPGKQDPIKPLQDPLPESNTNLKPDQAPGPALTPGQNPSTETGHSMLDCNANYSQIRKGGRGVCVNKSSGNCYLYEAGDVKYGHGIVACQFIGGNKSTSSSGSNSSWDCNTDYNKIRSGGQGICINRSSGHCYRYGNGDVMYSMGPVRCE